TFSWHGYDRFGNRRKGEIQALDKQLALHKLSKMGIQRSRVKRPSSPLSFSPRNKIKTAHVALFTRQLATMMKAGIPLVQSFDIVIQGLDHPRMSSLTTAIRTEIAAGNSFAESLRRYPRIFDALYCNLIEVGESSGALEIMLDRLATFKEKTEALKSKIRKAMNYPIAIILVALATTGIMLVKIVPALAETFSSFGAELPAFTLLVVSLSDWVIAYWWQVLPAAVLTLILFKEALLRSKRLRRLTDRALLRLPIFGAIVRASCYARFSRTLSTTYAAGVPLVDALASVAGATGNSVYEEATKQIRADVASGQPLHSAISDTALFPNMISQMASIGEESGTLDVMLERSASHFEAEVDGAVDSLTSLLEPAIIVVIGILVGGLVIAMYLPIFQLGSVI
ncbi:MAG: type II secretion system F family protein, partial [OM182 bacterium]|nr:type II secretion system F family protein [OM182 bacterium]